MMCFGCEMTDFIVATVVPWQAGLAKRIEAKSGGRKGIEISSDDYASVTGMVERLKPQYVFFTHWRRKVPREIYENYKCVIFHTGNVPSERGGSPIQNLIEMGATSTCVSAIECVGEVDAGKVYCKSELSLHGSAEEIYLRAADSIVDMAAKIMEGIEPVPQEGEVNVFKRRRPDQSNMRDVLSSERGLGKVYDMVRMLDAPGYPKAYIEVGGMRLEFSRAKMTKDGVIADVMIKDIDSEAVRDK